MARNSKKQRIDLDETDSKLIGALDRNARTSTADLARLVAMSPQSVTDRIRRLEDAGAIEGYSVKLDPVALGLAIGAYIRISPAMGELPRVARLVAEIPEIIECDRVTGDDCFIAKVLVKRVDELEQVIDRLLPYARTNTSVIQSSPVRRRQPAYSRRS